MNAVAGARQRLATGLEWPIVTYFAVMHGGALLLCPLFFSWTAVKLATCAYLVTGLGITVGYHRLLTHSSFGCPRWVERGWALLGVLAGEGPPLFWVMNHRKHHKFSDAPGDPHSPVDSFLWGHCLWLLPKHQEPEIGADYARWVPSLARQPFYRALETHYLGIQLAFAVAWFAAGYYLGSGYMALSFLGYGYFLRGVLVAHATWLVNSLAHTLGSAPYPTNDRSKNNALVATLALGEGWHNNHHAIQYSANHGHRWWQFDLSFVVILAMALVSRPLQWIGLGRLRPVHAVRVYRQEAGRAEVWFQ